MEPTPGPQVNTPVIATPPPTGVLGTKIPSSAAFLVAVLLFLMPFVEIRCNGTALASNTGLGIATGRDWKPAGDNNSLFGNGLGNNATADSKFEKQDANIFAILALVLGALGCIIAFLLPNSGGKLNLIIGIAAAVSLIAMLIDLKSKASSENSLKSSDLNFDAGMKISVDGTGAFFFAMILLVLGGVFSYLRIKNKQPT